MIYLEAQYEEHTASQTTEWSQNLSLRCDTVHQGCDNCKSDVVDLCAAASLSAAAVPMSGYVFLSVATFDQVD
jgi:hypothetical protein